MSSSRTVGFSLPLTLVCIGLLPACEPEFAPAALVTAPQEGEITDPVLSARVAEQLALVEAMPFDAGRRARLGLIYEANQVWTLAARAFENAFAYGYDEPMYAHHAAIAMQRCGRTDEANELIRTTSNRFPDFAPLRYRLALLKLDEGDAAGALVDLRAAAKLAPWFQENAVAQAEALIQLERYREALAYAEQTLRLRPGSPRALHARGLALQGLGRDEEALRDLERGQGATRSYLPDELSNQLLDLIVDSRILLTAVDDLRAKGEEERVYEMLAAGALQHPESGPILNALALAERRRGNSSRASELLERAIELEPNAIEFRINQSLAFLQQNKTAEANASARAALKIDDQNVRAMTVLARGLMRIEARSEALELLEGAYALEPDSYMASVSLGELQIDLGLFEEARQVLDQLVQREPEKYWPRHFLCIADLRLGFTQKARAGLEGLRAGFPQDPRLADLEAMMSR